jgi:hypothetical protein
VNTGIILNEKEKKKRIKTRRKALMTPSVLFGLPNSISGRGGILSNWLYNWVSMQYTFKARPVNGYKSN